MIPPHSGTSMDLRPGPVVEVEPPRPRAGPFLRAEHPLLAGGTCGVIRGVLLPVAILALVGPGPYSSSRGSATRWPLGHRRLHRPSPATIPVAAPNGTATSNARIGCLFGRSSLCRARAHRHPAGQRTEFASCQNSASLMPLAETE